MEASLKPKARVLQLVKRNPDKSILEYVEELHNEAKNGEVVGILIAAHYGGGDFRYVGAGSLTQVPTLGVGAAVRLVRKLQAE